MEKTELNQNKPYKNLFELNQTISIYSKLNRTLIIGLVYRFEIPNRIKPLEVKFPQIKPFIKEPNR